MTSTKRKPARPEQDLQRTVFEHLTKRGAPDMLAFHVPNGGARSKVEAAILKGIGVVPGIPDLFILQPGPDGYCKVTTLELKAPNGRISPAQCDVLSKLGAVGAITHICSDLDSALNILEDAGALIGKASLRTLGDVVTCIDDRQSRAGRIAGLASGRARTKTMHSQQRRRR